MTDRAYSLLDEPLIDVRTSDDTIRGMSLPDIYQALMEGDVAAFAALQPHQQQPWFSFLVQVAAMATVRHAGGEPPTDAAHWRRLLVELADGSEDAWHLVVDDVSKPAFLQPPIPEGSIDEAGYGADVPTPDALDMLITSKTHDIKQRRVVSPNAQHWVFALLTLQTQEGFLGRGNYGIVRMNGGFGNRPMVGLAPELDWGARFRRDLQVLVDHHDEIAETYELDPTGIGLLWTEPWDGKKKSAIALSKCDPFVIEICRRLRFTNDAGQLVCWRANTKGQRIDAPDDLNGRTGDPWVPIDKSDAKALTLGAGGFTYEVLQDIWFTDEYRRPPALEFRGDDPDRMYLIATTLARGQGKTEGWHRRIIPVPGKVSSFLGGSLSNRKKLAKRAKRRVELAAEVQSQVLRGPTFTLVYAGRSPSDPNWDKINAWIEAFDRRVDARFFDSLWDSVQRELSDAEAEEQWHGVLKELAEKQYREIRDSIPLPSIHRYRVLSDADSQFYGRLHSVLDRAFDNEQTPDLDKEETDERPKAI